MDDTMHFSRVAVWRTAEAKLYPCPHGIAVTWTVHVHPESTHQCSPVTMCQLMVLLLHLLALVSCVQPMGSHFVFCPWVLCTSGRLGLFGTLMSKRGEVRSLNVWAKEVCPRVAGS